MKLAEFILDVISKCETIGAVNEHGSRAKALEAVVPSIMQACKDALSVRCNDVAASGAIHWKDLAEQLSSVWWEVAQLGGTLQHGALDKAETCFSVVLEQHGGQCFHGDTPMDAWKKAKAWLMSPNRPSFSPKKMDLTLKWEGETGDGKAAFVVADQNDGWKDVRIELDTDDCDSEFAKTAMQEIIDRVNSANS